MSIKSSKKKRILKKMPLKVKPFQVNSKNVNGGKKALIKAKIEQVTNPNFLNKKSSFSKKLKFQNIPHNLEKRRNTKKKIFNKKLGFFKETFQKNLRLGRKKSRERRLKKHIQGRKNSGIGRKTSGIGRTKPKKRREFFKRKRSSKARRGSKENDSGYLNGQIRLQISRNSQSRESSLNFTFKDKSFNLTRNLSVKLNSFTSRNNRKNQEKMILNKISPRSISSKRGQYSKTSRRRKKSKSRRNGSRSKGRSHLSSYQKERSIVARRYKNKRERNQTLENIFKNAIKKIPNLKSRKHSVRSRASINSFENHFVPKMSLKNSVGLKEKKASFGGEICKRDVLSRRKSPKNLVEKIAFKVAPLSARSYSKYSVSTPRNHSFRFFANSTKKKKFENFKGKKSLESSVKYITKEVNRKRNEDDYNYGYLKKMSNMLKKSKISKKRQISKFTLKLDDLQKRLRKKF